MRQTGEDFIQNITIQSKDACFPEEQLRSIIQDQTLTIEQDENLEQQNTAAAWTEQKEEIIADFSSGRTSKANVIAIYGSFHCLLPFGKNLSVEDTDGCLISQALAEKLFGDFPAEDRQIIWNGSTWTIRGVLRLPAHCLLVQTAGKNIDLSYNRISIPLKNGENRQITGENLILRNNLSAYVLRLDYLYEWSWLQELIPSKWSDFDGWKQNWTNHKQAAELVKQMERSTLEATGLTKECQGGWFLLSGLFLCLGGTWLIRQKG